MCTHHVLQAKLQLSSLKTRYQRTAHAYVNMATTGSG
jgi:hypothetical protein